MNSIPRLARDGSRASASGRGLWHIIALALLALAPVQLWLKRPVWSLETNQLPQVYAVAIGYLAFVLVLHLASDRPRGINIITALGWGIACFGAAALLVLVRSDLALSRGLYGLCATLGITLAILAYFAVQWRGAVMAVLACIIIGASVLGAQYQPAAVATQRFRGTLYNQQFTYFSNLAGKPGRVHGGGIVPYGKDFLLVNGDGEVFRLWWNQKGDSLQSRTLGLKAPIGHDQLVADLPDSNSVPRLRATDLIIDSLSSPMRLLVAHMYWNHEGRCIALRVSETALDTAAVRQSAIGNWHTLYETKPCLKATGTFDDLEAGGRMAWLPDHTLLLTTGDFGLDGLKSEPLSQQMDNDYGKILHFDATGGHEFYSIGHRNPQGLVVARDGRIWETEHGPQGGDEINLIVKGGNYGWPFVTYGTEYGLDTWPLSPDARDHGKFNEPAHVFVPSVGVSAIIELGDKQFPRYAGDLLALSLRGSTVYRARTRGDRIVYMKPIELDRHMRALAEGSDGRVLIWTDEGDILALSRGNWAFTGAEMYRSCRPCHDVAMGTKHSFAPSLRGVVGRRVASVPDYDYSGGLRNAGGEWTKARLDSFLAQPAAFAPGSPMRQWAVGNAEQRRVLIDYLAELK